MLNQTTPQKIEKVIFELNSCFNKFDEKIKNKQHTVAKQDLDYWKNQLNFALDDIKNNMS